MSVLLCGEAKACFSEYLDGALTGVQMESMRSHMHACPGCQSEFTEWKRVMEALGTVGRVPVPAEAALRLRVAISQEAARPRTRVARYAMHWRNTVGPMVLRVGAGFASAVLLLGFVLGLVGAFVAPEPATARDEPIGMASPPRLLYSGAPWGGDPVQSVDGSIVVRVFVDELGRVYDYRVVAGKLSGNSRTALENQMLWSSFEPAHVFGRPVHGSLLISLTGLSVPG